MTNENDVTGINEEYTKQRAEQFQEGYLAAIRKMHGSGEMNGRAAANELLLLLPAPFVQAYERLFWTALSDPNASKARDGIEIARGNSGTVLGSDNRLQASGSGKRYRNTGFTVKSEKAILRKKWVDQKLESLVADIEASLRGESLKTRQCSGTGCRRMLDRKWGYCPSCGAKVR